jgi:ABC-type polysaccharide/polyol phosphate export permease
MQIQNASTPMRTLFLMIAVLIWVGIWLSGYDTVHWILYLPAAFLTFAAVTGICPGLHIFGKLFGKS